MKLDRVFKATLLPAFAVIGLFIHHSKSAYAGVWPKSRCGWCTVVGQYPPNNCCIAPRPGYQCILADDLSACEDAYS